MTGDVHSCRDLREFRHLIREALYNVGEPRFFSSDEVIEHYNALGRTRDLFGFLGKPPGDPIDRRRSRRSRRNATAGGLPKRWGAILEEITGNETQGELAPNQVPLLASLFSVKSTVLDPFANKRPLTSWDPRPHAAADGYATVDGHDGRQEVMQGVDGRI